ncbi:hypothetical protein JCM17844_19800 [Iodidimonas gelatinilytica]|uniref:TRAP transporter substrate-binding protein n=1 Tax=Iodidimonas gelatinilytica TaxID=1236966 RepID=A0A5A7N1T8_9PROT|nr:hypothetical protein JCM17844_19800 [Iodidimonas gelatinilytica]GER02078.1 hypothetical protein JCM17845_27010 [Iodidimonas gelatinilytica]
MGDSTNKGINRRTALKSAAGLGAAATGAGLAAGLVLSGQSKNISRSGPALLGQASRTLRMVTTWPKNFPGLGTGAARLAQRISDVSGGTLAVQVYAAGELVPALSAFDAVSQGKADLYHGAEYYWQGRSPAFNFFAAVPMGLTASEMEAWIRFGGGQALWDRLSARFNIKPFIAGNTGVQMGGWFKRPVDTLEDFRGLRIRMPGLGGEVMQRLGATPVTKRVVNCSRHWIRAISMQRNGLAHGTIWPLPSTPSPNPIIIPVSTNLEPHYPWGSIYHYGMIWTIGNGRSFRIPQQQNP